MTTRKTAAPTGYALGYEAGQRKRVLWATSDGNYIITSRYHDPYLGWEILAFHSDKYGAVTSWTELGGVRGETKTHFDAIRDAGYEPEGEVHDHE